MEMLLVPLEKVLSVVPFVGLVFLALYVGKKFYDWTNKADFDNELTNKDNPAFGVHLSLYMFGLAIALSGTLFGVTLSTENITENFVSMGFYSFAAILLMRLSVFINDKVVLRQFSIDKEILEDHNSGTGFVVGGACLATGLMINGSLSGYSDGGLGIALRDMVVYFAVGQLFLILGSYAFRLVSRYDVHHVVEHDNNVAAGLCYGGFLVALGIIVRASLLGAGSDLLAEIVTSSVITLLGLVFLVFSYFIADKVFLPKSKLSHEIVTDKNNGAAAVAVAVFLAIAVTFAAAVHI